MRALLALVPLVALPACATVPEPGGGGDNLPNAGAGPFRLLVHNDEVNELGNLRAAPNALDDDHTFARDPAVIDLDGDPGTYEVAIYVGVAVPQGDKDPTPSDPTRAILRFGAIDGRSFDRSAETVLVPEAAWEGGVIGQPSALRVGGEIWLYYAAAGGIGLATSADGHAFSRAPAPVLAPDASSWDGGAVPSSPGVVRLDDGSFRMFYATALPDGTSAIGEASSPDGRTFSRAGSAAALLPRPVPDAGEEPYDTAWIGSPYPVLATSAEGRSILRLYYGARATKGPPVVGLAARFGAEGAFERAVSPVLGTGKALGPIEPCVVPFRDFSLIFATEQASTTLTRPVVAVGVAPATAALPPANPP
ncbi:MAG: hypothetical protein U0359_24145 [Byssovorax sp.]